MCVCVRSEEHTSELQSHLNLVCRLLLEKKNTHRRRGPRQADRSRVDAVAHTLAAHLHSTDAPAARTPAAPRSAYTATRCSFFFNDTATTEIYTLSLHDALPICNTMNRLSVRSCVHLCVWPLSSL